MKLFISSTPNIRDSSLSEIFYKILLLLDKHYFDEILMLEKTPTSIKEYVFSLCDGVRFDFYVNIVDGDYELNAHIAQMEIADYVFVIEHPRVLYSIRRKLWCQKNKKPHYVFSI